jgi:hypothetical protein
MPCQEGVRAHDGSDLLEHSPPQVLRLGGQATALIVAEAQPARSELLAGARGSPSGDNRSPRTAAG